MTTGLDWNDDGSQGGLLNSRPAQRCLSEQEVEDFLFDRLSGVTRESIEEHLLVCTACLGRVEGEEQFVATFRSAARRLETEELDQTWNGKQDSKWFLGRSAQRHWSAALAGVAILLIAGVFILRRPAGLSEAQIALRVERSGALQATQAKAGQPLRLSPDATGLREAPSYAWVVVDHRGQTVATAKWSPAAGKSDIVLPRGLEAGGYWVRLQEPGGALLREFALQIR